MPKVAMKIAVSIPADLSQAIERARKKTRQSRSAVIQDALRYWLKHQAEAALVREYETGYRKMPETRREVKAAQAAAVRLFSAEEWS